VSDVFRIFARASSTVLGSAWIFTGAVLSIVVWGLTGPIFRYSNTWQLIINTGTTIITFLMVFLIQNTQNRDAKAVHLKLDELICALKSARNQLVDLEKLSDQDLAALKKQFQRVRKKAERKENNLNRVESSEPRVSVRLESWAIDCVTKIGVRNPRDPYPECESITKKGVSNAFSQ
jgi:low affinity Fe/Cu permease